MKLLIPTRLSVAVAATLAGHVLAASQSSTPPPQPPPARGGLQVQVTTGQISVVQPVVPSVTSSASTGAASGKSATTPPPPALPVSALLLNQSNRDLDVPFDSADAATRQFDFALYDSTGALLWDSNGDLTAGTETDATLPKQQAWKHTVLVPLIIDNVALTPGVYSVEMSVGSAKGIGAVATFEVIAPPAGGTGSGTPGAQPPGGGSGTGPGGGSGSGGGSGTGAGSGTGNPPPPPPPPGNGSGSGAGSGSGSGGGQKPPPPPPGSGNGSGGSASGTGAGSGGSHQPPAPPAA